MRTSCILAGIIAVVAMPTRAHAQAPNSATLTTTYTALNATATAADVNNGRIVVGYVDISVLCRRNNATCIVAFAGQTTTPTTRFVLLASGAGTPALNSCTTQVPTAQTTLFTGSGNGATTSRRLYVCMDLTWTTAPTTVAPTLTFQVTNG